MATSACPSYCWTFFSCLCNEEDHDSDSYDERPLLERTPPYSPPMRPPRQYGRRRPIAAPTLPIEDLASAVGALALLESGEDSDEDSNIYASLLPLVTAYKSDINRPMIAKNWKDILPENVDIKKIAEASYAEVYRVKTQAGSSILKVMRIKLPELPDSMAIETAIDVNSLISEIRIMNALTTVPGFVTFKDAHLVSGEIPKCLRNAVSKHQFMLQRFGRESYFPDLPTDDEEAWFLVVELGDAGDVLDDCTLDTVEKFWDVFIGTTIALARAEIINHFEHRDLHENNICIKLANKSLVQKLNPAEPLKYGFSGLEVTIIDYGLSRCQINGEIAACDLEQDLELFQSSATGIAGQQYDTYRRMRTHLIEGTRTMRPSEWHQESFPDSKKTRSWDDYIPYTNVLWLRYLFNMLVLKLKKDCPKAKAINKIEAEAKELKRRFDVRTKVKNGAFSTAEDVLTWIIQAGWVTEEQIAGDTTFLSEA